jgi:hypothetical protein
VAVLTNCPVIKEARSDSRNKSVCAIATVRLLASDQHDSEASCVSHHASARFGSFCKRNGFDHGTDFLQGAKEKRVLGIDRRSGHCSRNRAHTKKKWDRIDADRFISSGAGDNKLPAWSKSSEKWRHGLTVCAGSEDQQGAAKGLVAVF